MKSLWNYQSVALSVNTVQKICQGLQKLWTWTQGADPVRCCGYAIQTFLAPIQVSLTFKTIKLLAMILQQNYSFKEWVLCHQVAQWQHYTCCTIWTWILLMIGHPHYYRKLWNQQLAGRAGLWSSFSAHRKTLQFGGLNFIEGKFGWPDKACLKSCNLRTKPCPRCRHVSAHQITYWKGCSSIGTQLLVHGARLSCASVTPS